ncbi:MAG: diaminopimelate decarboxylase [Nitrospirae bacterium]|nr:MAG: diaminopimelate decarboxylase [Nitrospirota bacterium]
MPDFRYQDGELHCEAVPLRAIADKVGTPCYVYSHATLLRQFRSFDSAFNEIPHLVAYAIKANSNLALLRLLAREGAGADIVSGGELYRALQAGIEPRRIVFAGVGKSDDEIRYALKTDILMFNVESSAELRAIDRVAGAMKMKARVALRINPDIDPKTHPYISTGLKKSKFGISAERALEEFKLATTLPHLEIVGVHKHIGSQLTQVSPFVDALKKILLLVEQLAGIGVRIRHLNVGGGLGIIYQDETPPQPQDLAQAIAPLVKDLKCMLIFEPGRSIVGNAGVLVTKVLYHKANPDKTFLIVDAAMNDLIRPALYGAYHEITPVREARDKLKKRVLADVVGPVCESGDFLAKDRMMPLSDPGELLAVMSAGAYGFSMASNYNSRPRVAEVLVRGGEFHVIRAREEYADLVRGETIPAFLN